MRMLDSFKVLLDSKKILSSKCVPGFLITCLQSASNMTGIIQQRGSPTRFGGALVVLEQRTLVPILSIARALRSAAVVAMAVRLHIPILQHVMKHNMLGGRCCKVYQKINQIYTIFIAC